MQVLIIDLIIAVSIFGIAVGRLPALRMNRATIALCGAVLLVLAGGITLEQAFESLDLHALALIFSMMVISGNLRLSGFFNLVGSRITRVAHTPRRLLGVIVLLSGLLSALFLNDTIVLMFTPLVCAIAADLDRDPVPYLVGLALSANIGSSATVIGNPQNMLIGVGSGIDFFRFAAVLAVPALAGLGLAWLVVMLAFPAEFKARRFDVPEEGRRKVYFPLLVKCLIATGVLITGIGLRLPMALAALAAAAVLLVTRRVKPERMFYEIDWSLLALFAGLFVITRTLGNRPAFASLLGALVELAGKNIEWFAVVAAALSNLVSNVPAVMLLAPGVRALAEPERAWITLAMASTMAGNLTLLGSVANLIVAEGARRHGVRLGFWPYMKAGAIVTVLTIAFGLWWLSAIY